MKRREWAILFGGLSIIVGGAVWVVSPSAGEDVLYQAASECRVDRSFIYHVRDHKGPQGGLVAVEYGTDGHSQDFDCVQRRLSTMGVRPIIGHQIDA